MAHTVSAQSTGRATSGAVNPVRSSTADRKLPQSLNQEEQSLGEEAQTQLRDAAPPSRNPEKPAPDRETEAAARSAAKTAEKDSSSSDRPQAPSPEERVENIKQLERIQSEALYSGVPTLRDRQVAQHAHALIVRENANLEAHKLKESWRESERKEAARFLAAQAAAAYRQLDGVSEYPSGALIS